MDENLEAVAEDKTISSVPARFSRRETFHLHNTLLCIIKALENRCTTIDMRNETCVTGKIVEVDGFMNVIVSDAAVFDTDGEYQYFPILHIQARNIRNVHIPDNISILKAIRSQVIKQPKKPKIRKRTFKQSRAIKQQQETKKLIEEIRKKETEKATGS